MPTPTDSPALTAAPPNALLIWTDTQFLYTQLPGPDGLPYVIRERLDTTGLARLLSIIRTRAADTHDHTAFQPLPARVGTPSQRENAREVLKRLGFIG
jgi:hypothetical protein